MDESKAKAKADEFKQSQEHAHQKAAALEQACKDVDASMLDKILDDASKLLNDSDGKVQDNTTRDTMAKAITSRDRQQISAPSKAVHDSMEAKRLADNQAQASAQNQSGQSDSAQSKKSQSQQSSSPRRSSSSGSVRVSTTEPSIQPSPRQPESSRQPTQQQGSGSGTPDWNVPSPSPEPTTLLGTDPGL